MQIAPFVEKLHDAIKGMLVILTASEHWIGAVNLFNVCCVSNRYQSWFKWHWRLDTFYISKYSFFFLNQTYPNMTFWYNLY